MNRFDCTADVMQWTTLLLIVFLPLHLTSAQTPADEPLSWDTFESALSAADSANRYVFIDVYAPWCGWCQKMKQEVYADAEVASYLEARYERTRLNYDDDDTTYRYGDRERTPRQLAQDLKVYEVPGIVILNPSGEYLLHLSGFIEAQRLLSVLRYIGSEAYKNEAYSAYLERTDAREQVSPEE